ncbi:Hvo_1808 family surface protein [Natronolimnohabitans innermongolicus]|uniref:Lipoprotein n=1 Tax=Natronolimnohabitans innermongolicus JCM 12255 TaxID=1227499 RepID=L9X7N8_9EURY|nr:Hvo_1808 family surface protein [Natronolimnohabitans innermongolicus]ELY56638.1 hypothetical protein C493_09700 [Natronolimnohabitans innermongolicus JCM 12255]
MRISLTRTQLVVVAVAIVGFALVAVTVGAGPALFADGSDDATPESGDDAADRPDEPTTEGTVGYVNGYWYDDELAVDDAETAALEDDDLESVVYRSMARVEEIRDLTFEDDVPVDVISREEFQQDHDDAFVAPTGDERLKQDVTYEALFMVDNETPADDELESMYGGTVEGYYEPVEDRIVLVSENPDEPEVDEVVLGHELAHALQNQHFDLTRFDRATIDDEAAENGLVEGDAVWIDTEYGERCSEEWSCLPDAETGFGGQSDLNWGIYLALYQPYSDGPAYVDHLLEAEDGWDAVNAAYDDPPASASTIIHQDDRDPVEIDLEDRSDDAWRPLEVDGEVRTETAGETAMVGMFAGDLSDSTTPAVIEDDAVLETDDETMYDYDQPYTDDWAGDELVTYVNADAADGTESTTDDTGYVWETEWRSSEGAQEFATGYLDLLEIHDAEAVDDRRDTYVIDDEFPGAYFLERDGETVTIVRAPSVDDLDAIADGAAPEGDDRLERIDVADASDDDSMAGFGVPLGIVGVSGSLVLVVARRRGRRRRRPDVETVRHPTAATRWNSAAVRRRNSGCERVAAQRARSAWAGGRAMGL